MKQKGTPGRRSSAHKNSGERGLLPCTARSYKLFSVTMEYDAGGKRQEMGLRGEAGITE